MSDQADRSAHLTIIQGVITRMASNSFQLKAISVTFTAAVIAYLGAVPTAPTSVFVGAGLGVLVFWSLDAKYLRLEKLYRKLYNAVRKSNTPVDYDMDVRPFDNKVDSTLCIALSWSVWWVYVALLAALAGVAWPHIRDALK